MARARRRLATTASPSRRVWMIAGIIAFVLVDAGLVANAFAATRPLAHGTPGPIPTFTSDTSTPTPTPTPTATASAPTDTPAPAADVSATPAPRVLLALSGTEAWRSSAGSCDGADAVVEHSTDGGSTWTAADTSRYAIHSVVALSANPAVIRLVGGTGDACPTALSQSFTGGKFWAAGSLADAPNYVDPSSHQLHLSTGSEKAPCTAPLQVAESADGAVTVCADGLYLRTVHGSWSKSKLAGALSVSTAPSGFTVAAVGMDACTGISLSDVTPSTTGAPTITQLGCAPVTDLTGVTVGRSASAVWLWAGSSMLVSTDSGASWHR